jgi:hypothetical protein
MWSRASQASAAGALLLLSACAQPGTPPSCIAPLKPALEVSLYFGRDKPAGGQVSDVEWASFVTEIVTPQFPAGHSIVDAGGQYRDSSGRIVRESSKLVVIIVFDAPAHRTKVTSIVDTYVKRFGQESVLRVERPVCAGL